MFCPFCALGSIQSRSFAHSCTLFVPHASRQLFRPSRIYRDAGQMRHGATPIDSTQQEYSEMTASKIPIKKVCEHCKQEFVAWKTTTKYCSHQCNSRAYKSKRREERVQRTEVMSKRRKSKTSWINLPLYCRSRAIAGYQ